MIVRQNIEEMDMSDVWGKLSAPVPPSTISWRQDGRPVLREGKSYARFVAYIEANTVRERLDAVVAGEWDLTLDLLPPVSGSADDGDGQLCSFKARLQVMGVIREDVGTGRDYKQAATDAFKRAAVRFGVGHELYAYDTNWVQLDGEGRAAKPIEDPQVAYERRYGSGNGRGAGSAMATAAGGGGGGGGGGVSVIGTANTSEAECPKCGGRMWDNRLTKRNPRAPDFKCRDRLCDGVIWPARAPSTPALVSVSSDGDSLAFDASPLAAEDIPF